VLGRRYERENCSAARALELVGERWSLLIIRNAVFAGMTRFSQFERRLGIAPNILAKRLDGFVSDGLMQLRATGEVAGAHEYVLTQQGRELGLVVMALTEWGDRWAAPQGPPILFEHDGCGGSVHLSTNCAGCGQAPAAAQIVAVPGPGLVPTAADAGPLCVDGTDAVVRRRVQDALGHDNKPRNDEVVT
jgi:DNA-binding HxlR family transcriptional regulator